MPTRRRPVPVLVIAILQLVFGGFGVVCGLCGAVGSLAGDPSKWGGQFGAQTDPAPAKLQELNKQIEEQKVPAAKAYHVINQVLNWVLSFLMIASGLGLLAMHSWARWLAVGYAALSLLLHCVVAIYTIAFLNPAMQEAFQQMPVQDQQRLQPILTVSLVVAYAMVFVMPIYPIAVLVVMLLPSTGRAFQPQRREPEHDAEEFDERQDEDNRY
jgi:hypothetical protein